MRAFKRIGWVVLGVALGVFFGVGCDSKTEGSLVGDADELINSTVEAMDQEALILGQQQQFCGGEPDDETSAAIKTCVDAARTCKKECHKTNNNLEPFHSAIKQCKADYVACRKDEANDPKTCRETAKTCVKAAIDTLKPLIDCMKGCIDTFKTCVEAIPPADPNNPPADPNNPPADPNNPPADPNNPPADPQPDHPGDGLRTCFHDRHECEEACMPSQHHNEAVEACYKAMYTCFKAGTDPATCKADFATCKEAALANPPAPVDLTTCLTACADKFKECITALKP